MESNTLKPGSKLKNGEYVIARILGQGGFGVTYEAEQVSLGRKVAIKEFFMKDLCNRDDATLKVSVPSVGSKELVEKFRQKFIREAKMIAGFDNEHIVKIHDVFEENGTAYYVMEYLGGGSLTDMVKAKGALSESVALIYIRQIADALSYLHEQNTLHLDVKPSNVLLTQKGQLKLIDFGISKHYDEAGSQTSSTPVGISKGYAPLEQYQQGGDVSRFTPATDIYALGATLYCLVTGTVPPDASEVNEEGLPAMPGVSKNLADAIKNAMSPRKKNRPQSIEAFLTFLDEKTGSGRIHTEYLYDSEKTKVECEIENEPEFIAKEHSAIRTKVTIVLYSYAFCYLLTCFMILNEKEWDALMMFSFPSAIGMWCLLVWRNGMTSRAKNSFLCLTIVSVILTLVTPYVFQLLTTFCMIVGSTILVWYPRSITCKIGVWIAFILSSLILLYVCYGFVSEYML